MMHFSTLQPSAGTVSDCNAHGVAGARVTLERRVGSRWARAGSGVASATGAYSVAVRAAGRYRASVGGRRSAVVRVG
jgi:hypothetical protein